MTRDEEAKIRQSSAHIPQLNVERYEHSKKEIDKTIESALSIGQNPKDLVSITSWDYVDKYLKEREKVKVVDDLNKYIETFGLELYSSQLDLMIKNVLSSKSKKEHSLALESMRQEKSHMYRPNTPPPVVIYDDFYITGKKLSEEEEIEALRKQAKELNTYLPQHSKEYWVVKDGKLVKISREEMANAVSINRGMAMMNKSLSVFGG